MDEISQDDVDHGCSRSSEDSNNDISSESSNESSEDGVVDNSDRSDVIAFASSRPSHPSGDYPSTEPPARTQRSRMPCWEG